MSLLVAGVPETVVKRHKPFLRNMLGYVRGNIYYNLMNWYRCLACIPIGNTGKFMETMMGVKQVKDNIHLFNFMSAFFARVSRVTWSRSWVELATPLQSMAYGQR